MEITLNDKKMTVEENIFLQSLVNVTTGDKQKGIAVAVNDKVVPKSEWSSFQLYNNDSVLIIKATQGG